MSIKKANAKSPEQSGPDVITQRFAGATLLMPETPLTPTPRDTEEERGISFLTSPEDYAATARGQRKYFTELADRIERGDQTLTVLDGIWAAGAIRAYASQIPLTQPRGRGQLPKVDPGVVAIEFALLVAQNGYSKNKAHEALAEKFDVSVTAIKKALQKHGNQALSWLQNLKKK